MEIFVPNSAHLGNLEGFLRNMDPSDGDLRVRLHPRWVSVHPFVLASVACAAAEARAAGGDVAASVPPVRSLPYLVRMRLFDHLGVDPGVEVAEHEAAGRFVPLTQICTQEELSNFIVDVVPLLHASFAEAEPIRYVLSELVRNALEHSGSPVGCFAAAQYFAKSNRIAIGVADAGVGMLTTMEQFHNVKSPREAIRKALQPGITGTTSRYGGTEYNAGAGLFFTKAIACASRNFFAVYSGDALFKLRKVTEGSPIKLHPDPGDDVATWREGFPAWKGTLVGIDLAVEAHRTFERLLEEIRGAYALDLRARRKAKYKRPRFQ